MISPIINLTKIHTTIPFIYRIERNRNRERTGMQLIWQRACLAHTEPYVWPPALHRQGVLEHAFQSSTWGVGVEGSGVQSHPWLHSEKRGRLSGTPREDDVRVQYSSVLICGGHGVRRLGKQCSVAEDYSCFIRTVQGSGRDESEPEGPVMKQ